MPLVAHIDDERIILDGAIEICREIAVSLAVCEAAIMRLDPSETKDHDELHSLFSRELSRYGLEQSYAIVADMMAAAFGERTTIRALKVASIQDAVERLRDTSETDISNLIESASIVMTARTGSEFFEQIEALEVAEHPSLIVLDLKLNNTGEQSGLEILNTIRKHRSLQYVPVVMFTQFYDERYVYLGYKNGASSYHLKGGSQLQENLTHLLATWLILAKLPTPGLE